MSSHPIISDTHVKMQQTMEHTLHEFSSIHTGKASPSMVEGISVEAYGSHVRLKEVAAITTPDLRTIQIQPWDKSMIVPIERAIQMANIGINPSVNGGLIRLPLPDLNRERRQELVKVAHQMAEDGRISVRHARRDGLEALKKLQKEGEISEDEQKRYDKEIQTETDKAIKEIGEHLAHKEKELLSL
ncbi:MAG: ribosome recycling factor [Opitutaceae bacterium]|nr:ribosome recycling factor [Opitutaceae bacterium]